MDYGNDVDLSNNNIMPLWKLRTDNSKRPQDSSNPKLRPHSCHINGVMKTNFTEEDNKCSFTLSQPAERLVVTPQCVDNNTAVLKHVLHKPSKKNRVVRSISISHFSNGRLLSKFRSEDSKSASLDNRVYNRNSDGVKASNGEMIWPEKHLWDSQTCMSCPLSQSSQKGQIAFQKNSPSTENTPLNGSSPVFSPDTPNNNYNQPELSSLSSTCSSSPPTHRMLTPSYSSTSSIPSLNSLTSSDPPTPRSPSPEDRGQALLSQSQSSSPISPQDTRHTSSSSSMSSTSPSPSLSPSICPYNGIVLSTHSAAALKMGTQQLIPKGLASDIRQSKAPSPGTQAQGSAGLLGWDHSKRSLKALSMVETGSYFSTGGHNEGEDGESESPGVLRRGLRSTSYRRAVVSGVDSEVSTADPKGHRLSQPVIRGLGRDKLDSLVSPTSPGSISLPSVATNKPDSPMTPKDVSTKNSKPSLGTEKTKSNGKNKVSKSVSKKRVGSNCTCYEIAHI